MIDALALFLSSQGKDIKDACSLDIYFPGEGLNELDKGMERNFLDFLKSRGWDVQKYRRFEVVFATLRFSGYLVQMHDAWYVASSEVFLRIAPRKESEQH